VIPCVASIREASYGDDQKPPRYNRDKLRYPRDLTDAVWPHIKPLIPPAKRGGGKRRVDVRQVVNGVMYVMPAPPLARSRK
jgi:hypothetical protein